MGETNTISQQDQENFERFLLDRMDSKELELFRASLESDPDLKKAFEEFKGMFRAVEEAGLRSKLNEYHAKIEGDHAKTKPFAHSYRYLIAASIAFLIFIAGYKFIIMPNSANDLYQRYYTVDPGLPTVMGTENNYEFYKAMVAYKQGNYKHAIKEWELLRTDKNENDTLNYFLGSAYLANDNIKKAVYYLERVAKNNQSYFYSDSHFYLGLIDLKEGRTEKAKGHFEQSENENSAEILSQLAKK